MLKTIVIRQFLPLIVIALSFASLAQAQTVQNELSHSEKRQIIETLLKEKFNKSETKTIYISTVNLSDELMSEFPVVKNKKIQLVSDDNADELCAYEFGVFEQTGRAVSVSFGNCNEGLAYDFKKFGDRWKSVGLTIPK